MTADGGVHQDYDGSTTDLVCCSARLSVDHRFINTVQFELAYNSCAHFGYKIDDVAEPVVGKFNIFFII